MSSAAPLPTARATALGRITKHAQTSHPHAAPAVGSGAPPNLRGFRRPRRTELKARLRELRFVALFVAGVALVARLVTWLVS